MSHTPGPWIAVNTPSVGWEIKAAVKGYDGTPTIWHGRGGGFGGGPTLAYEPWVQFPPKELQEMFAANARLIAAAPDMKEAIKKFISCQCYNSGVAGDGICQTCWARLNVALDKATETLPTRIPETEK